MMKPINRHTVVDPRWWFVCVVVSNKEMLFRKELAKANILNFTPMKTIQIEVYGKRTTRRFPLFPNYVFVFGDHYKQFRRKTDWKGYLYAINENDELIYKMPHQIVYELMIKQALGEFDLQNRRPDTFRIGDIVDVIGEEEPEAPLFEKREITLLHAATIISVGSKRVTVIGGNKAWKIKFCYLRKSVDKSPPLGKAKFNSSSPPRDRAYI